MRERSETTTTGLEIAVVGLAGRFPGADNVDALWKNLVQGRESISFFSDEELKASGVPTELLADPHYVKARGFLENADHFDADFFGYSPREAESIDPQHRVFLECAWEGLENAGYDPTAYAGSIAVFAGASLSNYALTIWSNSTLMRSVGAFQAIVGADRNFLATRVSYKLNLRAPSVTIQTACSTSLVAVHLACRSLLGGECNMALAGGVSISSLRRSGYLYQEGGVHSPDGHCRAFDAGAQGIVGGSGAGVVVLKRLADALEDGDSIHAVIKGSAVNNDGGGKVGYTAPSVDGQAQVIAEALAMAETPPETITYVEAHGTGTPLGDPIEIAALTQVFRARTDRKQFCAIGAVKTNVGHLDAAAGVTGLIKAVLALKNGKIPPTLHFDAPNPEIDFENSPFFVNTSTMEWVRAGGPRRAGVSSFGIGGTNAHVILEEAPSAPVSHATRAVQVLTTSARTEEALETATSNLCAYLEKTRDVNLADVAYTLQVGRKRFPIRRTVVCRSVEGAIRALRARDPEHLRTAFEDSITRSVVFMFPGGGSQHVNAARELYETEQMFREKVDHCSRLLESDLGLDLRDVLYPDAEDVASAAEKLARASIGLPALFVIEYGLAKLWMEWGVRPQAMIGHSAGECVAACLAGVLSLPDALALIACRGRILDKIPAGAMLTVQAGEELIKEHLGTEGSLAAVNASGMYTVSGNTDYIASLERLLRAKGVETRRLKIATAAHSASVSFALDEYVDFIRGVSLHPPKIPYISCVTGTWISDSEATDPDHWARQLRETVQFARGARELLRDRNRAFLEVGPGTMLGSLMKMNADGASPYVLSSLPHPLEDQPADVFLHETVGALWSSGSSVDWTKYHGPARRRRLPLPSYPFQRRRYAVELPAESKAKASRHRHQEITQNTEDWFYLPSWTPTLPPRLDVISGEVLETFRCLLFVDDRGVGSRIGRRLRESGHDVTFVFPGDHYEAGEEGFVIDPRCREHYHDLIAAVAQRGELPHRILHSWSVTGGELVESSPAVFEDSQFRGYFSLLHLSQALAERSPDGDALRMIVVTDGVLDVSGLETLSPEKATILGPCKVIPQENPTISCTHIDIDRSITDEPDCGAVEPIAAELLQDSTDPVVAYRGDSRWVLTYERVRIDSGPARLRDGGVYLITGGLGTVGLHLAKHLARKVSARLVLMGRSELPERADWDPWLATHGEGNGTSKKILGLLELEEIGAEVMVVRADVADEGEVREVLRSIEERFGGLNGVLHAAGVTEGGSILRPIAEMGAAESAAQFRPKVHGLYVLERCIGGSDLDFCLLFSSNASTLGGIGLVAYSAANAFMDVFARDRSRASGIPWISANWDGWRVATQEDQLQTSIDKYAMTPLKSVEAFERVISLARGGHVVVSAGDFGSRFDLWVRQDSNRDHVDDLDAGSHRRSTASRHVAPRNEIEAKLAKVWQEVLGIKHIGVDDNFFELGGHSLMGMQVVSRIRKIFEIEIPLRALFQGPTIAEMAMAVIAKAVEQTDEALAGQVLEELEQLSEEDARSVMARERGHADE